MAQTLSERWQNFGFNTPSEEEAQILKITRRWITDHKVRWNREYPESPLPEAFFKRLFGDMLDPINREEK